MTSGAIEETQDDRHLTGTYPCAYNSSNMSSTSSVYGQRLEVHSSKTGDSSLPYIAENSDEQHPYACSNAPHRTDIAGNCLKLFVSPLQYNDVENYSRNCQDTKVYSYDMERNYSETIGSCNHREDVPVSQNKPYSNESNQCCSNRNTSPNMNQTSIDDRYANVSHKGQMMGASHILEDECLKIEDKELLEAANEFSKSGSMLPIIKQELRLKIQHRRVSEGQNELVVDFLTKAPQQISLILCRQLYVHLDVEWLSHVVFLFTRADIAMQSQLTKGDIQRREVRRLSNRKAAQRSRVKRKRKLNDEIETISYFEKKNKSLKSSIQKMECLKREMLSLFKNHKPSVLQCRDICKETTNYCQLQNSDILLR